VAIKSGISEKYCPARTWTALVPVRGGSKGLPGKNMLKLNGKPLYMHSVDMALAAGAANVVLTTDITEILVGKFCDKVRLLSRPASLCGDDIPMAPVIEHAILTLNLSGNICLLQPTTPLRRIKDIKNAFDLWELRKFDLVMSVTNVDSGILKYGFVNGKEFEPISDPEYCFSNRQLLPKIFKPNGAIYIFNASTFLKAKSFPKKNIGAIKMPISASIDIDSIEDFNICQSAIFLNEKVKNEDCE
jgi:N-acylneuraminate cytidylyltransferase